MKATGKVFSLIGVMTLLTTPGTLFARPKGTPPDLTPHPPCLCIRCHRSAEGEPETRCHCHCGCHGDRNPLPRWKVGQITGALDARNTETQDPQPLPCPVQPEDPPYVPYPKWKRSGITWPVAAPTQNAEDRTDPEDAERWHREPPRFVVPPAK